jgi:enediyne polyketide synthase
VADQAATGRPAPAVAVVGLACRFPDADDAPELLDIVLTGRRSFRRIPLARLDVASYYQPDRATSDATYSTRAALIAGWQFDGEAFGVDRAGYSAADPALWLALETAARALAGAGLTAGTGLDRDRTGVIIGNTLGGEISRANALRVRWPYVRHVLTDALAAEVPPGRAEAVLRRAEHGYLAPFPAIGPDTLAGSTPAGIAAAISGYFGFRGASHAVDAACSSSLQAVASACGALTAGDLDAVVTGGVDISLDPLELIGLAKAGVLASGDVRIYDENPTGYLPAEGCGMVVLMRTADARAAGLPVYAEIVGWGVSAAGGPGDAEAAVSSQLLAMRRAYERAQLDPCDVQLFEGNGASTKRDDDAELIALEALRTGARQQAALGSVKANIGHAKAASGSASLIKTVLALSTGVIPPATGVVRPHALISGGTAGLELPAAARQWPDGHKIAAVSALDSAGTSVHVVLRAEPAQARPERWPRLRSLPVRTLDADDEVSPRLMVPPGEPVAYLLQAQDRFALTSVLTRIASIGRWLSDAELQDLACLLGREQSQPGGCRVALVAAGQDQLAARASEAAALLPGLTEGLLATRPGIFAADAADGRVTLLLSGESAESPAALTAAAGASLDTLRWLESLDVHATCAVGHGLGALVGLAWVGVLGEGDVVEIAKLRAQFLDQSAADADAQPTAAADAQPVASANGAGKANAAGPEPGPPVAVARVGGAGLRAAIAQKFRLGPPRRRLISTLIGAEIKSVDDAIDLICSGFSGATKVAEAVTDGAIGATLLFETGPGATLSTVATEATPVPAVGLPAGLSDPAGRAHAAAALFAIGAVGQPQALFAGWPARPIDIWREPRFIASPCELLPRPLAATVESATVESGTAEPPAGTHSDRKPADGRAGLSGVRAEFERKLPDRPLITAATGRERPDGQPAGNGRVAGQPAAASSWASCFTETLVPADHPALADNDLPWRTHIAGPGSVAIAAARSFRASTTASRTLAILGDPGDEDSRAAALHAARDAITTGQLVVLTASAGFTGFFASLQAEHPELGVTVLRVPNVTSKLGVTRKFAYAEPGTFRELVIAPNGSIGEPALSHLQLTGGGPFPLGPEDVVLVSRGARGAGLALAQVLACCGTPVAVIGRATDSDDSELVAGLEQLRSAGARIGYEVIDITDRASLAAAVERIEARLGPVTAIGHAVGQVSLVPFMDLTDIEISDHVTGETAILDHLVESARPDQLRMIVTFGSVAGRYGLAGASVLALGSGALAGRAEQLAAATAGCRSLHVSFPAWSTGGLGDPPSLADDFAAAGTAPIDVSVASRQLLKILTTADLPDRLAVHGQVSGPAARMASTPSAADLAAAGLANGGRFLQDVRLYYPGTELVCAPRLSLQADPYLADYQVDGLHMLPPALALEALTQAASVLAGRPVLAASDVRLESPVVVPAAGEAELQITARRTGPVITAVLRCQDSSFAVDHATAEFPCTGTAAAGPPARLAGLPSALSQLSAGPSGLVDGAELYGPIAFQSGRFRRVGLLPEVTARSCSALARGSDEQPWFDQDGPAAAAGFVLGNPGLNDAIMHVAQACVPHRRVRPAGCDSVKFSPKAADGAVEIRAVATTPAGPRSGAESGSLAPALADERWNVDAVNSAGELLVSWRGLRLRDAGSLPRNAAWPPPLLAVFLERGSRELGLDAGLRVTVGCGQPDGPGPVLPAGSAPRPAPRAGTVHRPAPRAGTVHRPAPPAGTVPRPAPPADDAEPPASNSESAGASRAFATGTGPLAGFSLGVSAGVPVACGWNVVEPGHRHDQPSAGLARVYAQLRGQLAEPPATLAARLRAIGDCLAAASPPGGETTAGETTAGGPRSGGPLTCERTTSDGWVLLQAGAASIACTVVDVSGVAGQVAIAVLTGQRPARTPQRESELAVTAGVPS